MHDYYKGFMVFCIVLREISLVLELLCFSSLRVCFVKPHKPFFFTKVLGELLR
jgi:hypothetical protein